MAHAQWVHPCVQCGACCASYRVAFAKSELSTLGIKNKLQDAVVDLGGEWLAMRGTESKHRPACVSLTGRIGKAVSCELYAERPSPCREFKASYENGVRFARCDEARSRHGLLPLQRTDWLIVEDGREA